MYGMPTSLPQRGRGAAREKRKALSESALLGWTLALPVTLCVLSGSVPAALVMPALGITAVIAALGLSGWTALVHPSDRQRWDLAGALLFIGFGASMLGDVPEALRALDHLGTANGIRTSFD